jgi:hypothetical protein
MDTGIIVVVVAAFVGSLVSGTAGWLESKEVFDIRKFTSTILRGLVTAVVWAIGTYTTSPVITWFILLGAFASGAGVDAILNRVAGIQKTPPAVPPPVTPPAGIDSAIKK